MAIKNRISNPEYLTHIAQQFNSNNNIKNIESLGKGNINDTFLITLDQSNKQYFVLQNINTQVFAQPKLVMQNIRTLNNHVHNRLKKKGLNRRWEIPSLIPTIEDQDYYSEDGTFWRAISFIENSRSFETINNLEQAKELGFALGMFHYLISDLPAENLADTLKGFHITPDYLNQYENTLIKSKIPDSLEKQYCLKFIESRKSFVCVLEKAKNDNKLPLRLMHGDPKVNNVMFDLITEKAISIIDLDTVKPGLIHYDLGDCLRSGGNPKGEETQNWQEVYFDIDLCESILQGYLQIAKSFFTQNDYKYIFDSIRLITFELGLRFFTDYLAGDVYFKVNYPEHNLYRALVQFQLTKSIESQQNQINQIVQKLQ